MCFKTLISLRFYLNKNFKQENWLLENGTRIELSLSEISDEEVDYGSYASNVDLDIASDSSWSAL